MADPRQTRAISWIKAALKDFEAFPTVAQPVFLTALTKTPKPEIDLVKDGLKGLKEALR